MKKRNYLKNKRGSIALFVLLSMLFFLVIVTSVATSSKNKETKVNTEYAKIKSSYEKDVGNETRIYQEKIKQQEAQIKTSELTINPNGGTWNSLATNSTVTQKSGTSFELGTSTPAIITFNEDGGTLQDQVETISFVRWNLSGSGSLSGNTYTFGDEPATVTAEYSKTSITLPRIAKNGYNFAGWYNGTTKVGDAGDIFSITGSVTLTAHWTEGTYTVTFNPGAEGTILGKNKGQTDTKEVTYGLTYGTLPTPTSAGYTFAGWFTDAEGGTQVTAETVVNLSSDQTLYAHWTGNPYNITYDYNGGVNASNVMGKWDARDSQNTATTLKDLSGKGNDGTILSNAKLENDHITFSGTSTASGVTFTRMNSSYMTIEATFSADQLPNHRQHILCNVQNGGIAIYINNDGIIGGEIYRGGYKEVSSGITAEVGKKYHVILSYDGVTEKIFVNGELKSELNISGTIVTPGSSTVMALGGNPTGNAISSSNEKFIGKIYSAAVYSNTNTTKQVTQGAQVGELPTPTREGYTFNGWYINDTKVESTSTFTNAADARLVARWTPNTYTIKYNADVGATGGMNDTIVTYDQEINLPTNTYTKEDYTVFEWNTNADKTGIRYQDEENILNLTAENNGIVNLYTEFGWRITYNLNGGTLQTENPTRYNRDTGTITLNNPSKTGNDYLGWTGSNGETPEINVTIPAGTTGDLNYTANFDPHKLHIQYNANGGNMASRHGSGFALNNDDLVTKDGSIFIHTVNYGASLSPDGFYNWNNTGAINIEKTGYTITSNLEWNSKSDGTGTSYNQISHYTASTLAPDLVNGDVTLTVYANWKPIIYTVNFDKNDENATGEMEAQSFTYSETKQLSKNTFEKKHYKFIGWNTQTNGTGTSYEDEQNVSNLTTTENEQVTLYAQWEGDSYTVSFNAGNGTTVSPANKPVTYNSTYGTLPTPTRTGYTFAGWFTEEDGGTQITAETVVNLTADQTLYAHWTVNTYTVTFNPGTEGTIPGKNKGQTDTNQVTYGSTYGTLPEPTRTGYTFAGWFTEEDGGTQVTAETIVNITADQTLYAHWNAQEYTITLNNQSATSAGTGTIYETYEEKYSLTSGGAAMTTSSNAITKPQRTGYSFEGYYTAKNGEGKQVIDSNGFVAAGATATEFNSNGILYAKWKDSTNPSLTLKKETTQDGFDDWQLSGGAFIDSNGILNLPNSGSIAKTRYYQAEEPWYVTYDSYTTTAYTGTSGGSFFVSEYYNSELTKINNKAGAASNNWNKKFNLNEWTRLDFSNIASNNKVYGGNIKYITLEIKENTSYSKNPQRIKNFKVHGQLWSTFYDIKITATDSESGVKTIKYDSGERNEDYFATNGTEVTGESARVTANGTYTVYVEDNAGNKTVKTIVINKIDNTAPTNTAPTYTKTANSITVTNGQVDNESGILKVEYAIKESGEEYGAWQSSNEFTGLRSSTTYNIKTRTTNNMNQKTESEEVTVTTDTIEYVITLDDQEATTSGTGTIYENYENKYSLTSGGTAMTPSANPIIKPQKTGYQFTGYYTEQNSAGTQVIDANGFLTSVASNTLFTSNSTIYAGWSAGTWMITFDARGGTTSESTRPVTHNTAIGTLPTAEYENHIFKGWFTAPSGGTQITASTTVTEEVTYYAQWEDAIAEVNGVYYNTLAAAIASVTTSDETTIRLVNNTGEKVIIESGQNIIFDFGSNTLSNIPGNNDTDVIENKGQLKIISGNITTDSMQGVINNRSGATLIITAGTVTTTGSCNRQAIYNEGGTVEISGGYFSARAATSDKNRGTVQNLSSGTMTITGGTIESPSGIAVLNSGTMTIGTQDGQIDLTSIEITGEVNGIYNDRAVNLFDGNIKGKTSALSTYATNKIGDKETGYRIGHERVDLYDCIIFIATHTVTFNPNGGNIDSNVKKKDLEEGQPLGTLPVPTRAGYKFLGWFDSLGTQVTEETTMGNDHVTYYAHWQESAPAEVEGQTYSTVQKAIDSNPSGAVINLIADATEYLTIPANKEVTINLDGHALSNNGTNGIIKNKGNLTISSGRVDSTKAGYSAIDNDPGATLTLDGVKIIATGDDSSTANRQTVYNSNGTVYIRGNTYLESKASGVTSSAPRSTVHNLNGGIVYIESATIINKYATSNSNANAAVTNAANSTVVIGIKDGLYNQDSPTLIGKKYGLYNKGTVKYYDGTINGKLGAINGTAITNANIEDYHDQDDDTTVIKLEGEDQGETYYRHYLLKPVSIIPSSLEPEFPPLTVTIRYNSTIVSGKKAGFGVTPEEAMKNASESTANSLELTTNGYVYAEGIDSNGETKTQTLQITNIIV